MSSRDDRQPRPTSPLWECNLCLATRGVKCATTIEIRQGVMRRNGRIDPRSGTKLLACAGCLSNGITTIVT